MTGMTRRQEGGLEKVILRDVIVINEKKIRLKNIVGEIIKIRVIYANCLEQTTIVFRTSENEEIKYAENNRNFVDYPKHLQGEVFVRIYGSTSQPVDNYYNFGKMDIQILNAGEDAKVERIVILLRK